MWTIAAFSLLSRRLQLAGSVGTVPTLQEVLLFSTLVLVLIQRSHLLQSLAERALQGHLSRRYLIKWQEYGRMDQELTTSMIELWEEKRKTKPVGNLADLLILQHIFRDPIYNNLLVSLCRNRYFRLIQNINDLVSLILSSFISIPPPPSTHAVGSSQSTIKRVTKWNTLSCLFFCFVPKVFWGLSIFVTVILTCHPKMS